MKLSILLIFIINFGCQNDLKKKTKRFDKFKFFQYTFNFIF